MSLHELTIVALAATIGWAAVNDAFWFRIPNVIPLAVVGLYPVHLLVGPHGFEGAHWALALALGVFAAGFFLFSRGAMGGGDVKLLTALTLWAGPAYFPAFILVTAIAGGVLALTILLAGRNPLLALATLHMRAALGLPAAPAGAKGGRTIPYGIAIAIGGLLLCRQLSLPGA